MQENKNHKKHIAWHTLKRLKNSEERQASGEKPKTARKVQDSSKQLNAWRI